MRILLCVLLVGALNLAGRGQQKDRSKLDAFMDAIETSDKFMGSVAIFRNGEPLYTRSIGYLDKDAGLKANEETMYRIGSISKTYTAVLVFKAIEEGKINLQTTIDAYFPTLKNSDRITVAHLLSHRSGIFNVTSSDDYMDWHTRPQTEADMLAMMEKYESVFEPDSRTEYSNSNFILLSYILQKIYGKSYGDLLTEKIIKPLGLTRTAFAGRIDVKKNECHSYKYLGSWQKEEETDPSIPMGAGAIISSASDVNRFAQGLLSGKLLKAASLNQMQTIREGMGMGLFELPFYKEVGYGHTGGIDGFSSVFAYFVNDSLSFAMTSNGTNFNNNDISLAALNWVYDLPIEMPVFNTYDVKEKDLDMYTGTYGSSQLPLKINISKSGNFLIAQATGQSAFPLDATSKDKFKYDKAGIIMEFVPAEKKMILRQGGGVFTFVKEM